MNRHPHPIWHVRTPLVRTSAARAPPAAGPPPTRRAAESRARLCCILDRQSALAAGARAPGKRPAGSPRNGLCYRKVRTPPPNRPTATTHTCAEESIRPDANRPFCSGFAATAIKKCRRAGSSTCQIYQKSMPLNTHFRSTALWLRRRALSTLQTGGWRTSLGLDFVVEVPHVDLWPAARRWIDPGVSCCLLRYWPGGNHNWSQRRLKAFSQVI